MTISRTKIVGLVLFIVMLVASNLTPPAQAAFYGPTFVTAGASCMDGFYVLNVDMPVGRASGSLFGTGSVSAAPAEIDYLITVMDDATGDTIGESTISVDYDELFHSGETTVSGRVYFTQKPIGPTVTFYLTSDGFRFTSNASPSFFGGATRAMANGYLDTITVNYVPCGVAAAPGCEMVDLTGAAVGRFVADAALYYAPDPSALVYPVTTVEQGKTLWVFGMDKDGEYYKVLVGCTYVWVPVETLGPNPDAPWNGAALPAFDVE